MTLHETGILVCWSLAAAGLGAYIASVMRQITYVTLADGSRAERTLPADIRLLLPFAPNLLSVTRRPFCARAREAADRMLVSAGYEGVLAGDEFLTLKMLLPLVCGSLAAFGAALLSPWGFDVLPGNIAFSLALAGYAYFYIRPVTWLRGALKRRHNAIVRALPFVLDLLTLSVEAGMDFMSALQRNCERRKPDALNEELMRMTREIQVGTPRRTALRNLSARVGQPDLKSVAYALIQADELGVSIGSILRIQSDQLRTRRFERAEKLASEAPVKMLGPLMLCIFPAVFLVLLGPVLMQAAKSIF